jgi:hypothetical protein
MLRKTYNPGLLEMMIRSEHVESQPVSGETDSWAYGVPWYPQVKSMCISRADHHVSELGKITLDKTF